MYEEYNCKHGSKLFKIFTGIVILDIIFITSVAFVFLKDYFMNVKKTFNNEDKTYTIKYEFIALYICSSFSTIIFVLYITYIIIWLIINYVC